MRGGRSMETVFQAAGNLEKDGKAGAVCTVFSSEGSTPRHVGSKMLVYPDGHIVGTVGGGDLEHRVVNEALQSIIDGQSRRLRYNLADPSRGDPGVCGGQVEVFVEPILPAPTVVVIGGGHVGKAVAHLAKWLKFRVIVSDDRQEYCNKDAVPDADEFHLGPMAELASRIEINSRTFLVLTTRGSSLDAVGLPALLRSGAPYIGVIGSKRRWATTVRELKGKGVKKEQLEAVHSPMGLELHAETPEEIAVSIMAEVLMVRDRGTGKSMKATTGSAEASTADGVPAGNASVSQP
jgi:xanthine dehydrogenase accessory factor